MRLPLFFSFDFKNLKWTWKDGSGRGFRAVIFSITVLLTLSALPRAWAEQPRQVALHGIGRGVGARFRASCSAAASGAASGACSSDPLMMGRAAASS